MALKKSLHLATLATVAVRGLDAVATCAPQYSSSDFRYCGVLDSRGRHWVVQEPLHAQAATALEAELPILAKLDLAAREDLVSFAVPCPEGSIPRAQGWRVIVYRELPGHLLQYGDLTPGPGPTVSLAQAIAQIHELPHEVVSSAGAPVYDANSYRQRRLNELDDAARTTKVPPILLARWESALEDVALWKFVPTVVHGDLAPENVKLLNGEVVALLNWANAHVGDPASDLSWLYAAAPEESLDTLEEGYSAARSHRHDDFLAARAMLYSELAVARWLVHGVRIGSESVVSDAETMLHTLALQVADSEPIGRPTPVLLSESSPWQVSGSLAPNSPTPVQPHEKP